MKSGAVYTLRSIFELGSVLNSAEKISDVIRVATLSLMGKLGSNCGAGFVWLDGKFKLVYSVGTSVDLLSFEKFNASGDIVSYLKSSLQNFSPRLRNFILRNSLEYAILIKWRGETIGIIFIGKRLKRGGMRESERDYIRAVANFAGIALKNIISTENLKRRIYDLSTLNEFSRSVFTRTDEREILDFFCLTVLGHFKFERVAVAFVSGNKVKLFSLPENLKLKIKMFRRITALGEVLRRKELMKIGLADFEVALTQPFSDGTGKAVMIAGGRGEELSDGEIEIARTFLSTAVGAVENLRLINLNHDMKLAGEIQKNLLPRGIPKFECLEIGAINIPSRIVGGDYYDVIPVGENEVIVAIADVCGKGISASLLMANLQASLRSVVDFTEDICEIVSHLNRRMILNTAPEQFVSFFICKVNLSSFELEYVNAGHNPTIFISGGEVMFLEEGGPVLGVIDDEYRSGKVKVSPGDIVFLYTDGMNEAMNRKGIEFGLERIVSVLKGSRLRSAEEILKAVMRDVENFTFGGEQSDDITAVVLKFSGRG